MATKETDYLLWRNGAIESTPFPSISDGSALSKAINLVLDGSPSGEYTLYRVERAINEPLARLEKADGGVLVYPINI